MTHTHAHSTAVAVGGSIAGLAAAHALATRMERVVLVERHPIPDTATSVVPQGALPHVLLAAGAAALERLDPGCVQELYRAGAVGEGERLRPCYWWAAGAVRRELPLEVEAPLCSRDLLEATLRNRLHRRGNVTVVDNTSVRGLHIVDGRVRGVHIVHGRERGVDSIDSGGPSQLSADLVIDATGRAGRGVGWLQACGYRAPSRQTVSVDITYTAVDVGRDPHDLDGARFAVVQNTPQCSRIGVALPAEGGRWQIVLGSYFGHAPTSERRALEEFAPRCPTPYSPTWWPSRGSLHPDATGSPPANASTGPASHYRVATARSETRWPASTRSTDKA